MRTSLQWWEDTISSPDGIFQWLLQQYQGEANASQRIDNYIFSKAPEDQKLMLLVISAQETRHSTWIRELLLSRNISLFSFTPSDRYWSALNPPSNYKEACAIASHAEGMRLERIKVIVEHPDTPEDIREVFKRILIEEQFHYEFFTSQAEEQALVATAKAHAKGLEALGLII